MAFLPDRKSVRGVVLAAALALLSSACAAPDAQQAKEVLLFAEIGDQSMQDSISQVAPDGSNFKLLLPRQAGRSFLFAHGNSARTHLLVIAHEAMANNQLEDHLFSYVPRTGELTRLAPPSGDAGFASLAPDDARIAFEFVPADQPLGIQLWLTDRNGQSRALTRSPDQLDRFPVWRLDGSELWFLRVQFKGGRVESSLMRMSPDGGEPTVVFGPSEHVGAVAFAPDNQRFVVWMARGLEVADAGTLARTVVLPIASLPNYVLQAGSLAWSRKQELLAFVLVNTQTGANELWTASADGANARPIYRVEKGSIFLGGFVEQ